MAQFSLVPCGTGDGIRQPQEDIYGATIPPFPPWKHSMGAAPGILLCHLLIWRIPVEYLLCVMSDPGSFGDSAADIAKASWEIR